MTAQEFVQELKKCIPSAEEMMEAGVSAYTRNFVTASYTIAPKKQDCFYSDPLLELLFCYDASQVEIGMVRFVEPYVYQNHILQIGEDEADPLFYDTVGGSIYCVEHATDHVLYRCASSGSRFLEALVVAACFLERCGIDVALSGNYDAKLEKARECAELAGGDEYFPFYENLLGVF